MFKRNWFKIFKASALAQHMQKIPPDYKIYAYLAFGAAALTTSVIIMDKQALVIKKDNYKSDLLVDVSQGHYKTVKDKLKKNILTSAELNNSGILHSAVDSGNVNMVHLILKVEPRTIDSLYPNYMGILETPLILATRISKKMTRVLIERGADVNKCDSVGSSALITAAKTQSAELVKMLLDAGANPLIENKKGKTALEYCIRSPEVFIMIYDKCYWSRKKKEQLLIQLAKAKQAQSIIKLLESNTSYSKKDDYGYSALDYILDWPEDEKRKKVLDLVNNRCGKF